MLRCSENRKSKSAVIMFSFVRGPGSIFANDGTSVTQGANRRNQKRRRQRVVMGTRKYCGVMEKISHSRNASSTFVKYIYNKNCSLGWKMTSVLDSSLRAHKSFFLEINITMMQSAFKCFLKKNFRLRVNIFKVNENEKCSSNIMLIDTDISEYF